MKSISAIELFKAYPQLKQFYSRCGVLWSRGYFVSTVGHISEATVKKYIEEQIARDLSRETDFLLHLDVRKFLLKKAGLVMPEAFLKNWLYTINEGKFSMEEIDKDFDRFLDMMRWNLIQKHYIDALKLEVTPEEATEEAKKMAAAQFAYYGIPNVDGETLANYAKNILGNKEENRKVYEKLFENKVIDAVIPQITVSEKAISAEDFGKLVQDAQ